MTDFDDEGFSATVKFTSTDADGGGMMSHLVRGMVSAGRSSWALSFHNDRNGLLQHRDVVAFSFPRCSGRKKQSRGRPASRSAHLYRYVWGYCFRLLLRAIVRPAHRASYAVVEGTSHGTVVLDGRCLCGDYNPCGDNTYCTRSPSVKASLLCLPSDDWYVVKCFPAPRAPTVGATCRRTRQLCMTTSPRRSPPSTPSFE